MAFYYHPLWPVALFFIIIVIIKTILDKNRNLRNYKYLYDKVYVIICVVVIILFLVVYVLRMINPNDTIVVFNYKDGFIYKTLMMVVSIFNVFRAI